MDFSQLYILLDVLLATFLCMFIGFEREKADKPAGIRTNMIVGGSACLIVAITQPLIAFITAVSEADFMNIDPIRVLEALVVGVSFIGAGTILKSAKEDKVTGLTTAATLLYSSGIGVCVALKQYILAVGLTLLILLINYVFNWVMKKYSDAKD